jgi:hypothetical protein
LAAVLLTCIRVRVEEAALFQGDFVRMLRALLSPMNAGPLAAGHGGAPSTTTKKLTTIN